jgi:hypothetical protein
MNALARWKILLALIATFATGAITGGFSHRTRDQGRRASRLTAAPAVNAYSGSIAEGTSFEFGTGRQDRFDPDANGK